MSKKLVVALAGIGLLVVLLLVQRLEEHQGKPDISFQTDTKPAIASRTDITGQQSEQPPSTGTSSTESKTALPIQQSSTERDDSTKQFIYVVPKTDKDIRWKRRHESLLGTQQEIATYLVQVAKQGEGAEISVPDLKKWADAIYRDAVLAFLLEEDLPVEKRQQLLQQLDDPGSTPDLEVIAGFIPTTSKYYGPALIKLLATIYSSDINELSPRKVTDLTLQFEDLAHRRKRNSDTVYMAEIRSVLEDEELSVDQKIRYIEPFIAAADWRLVAFASSFFSYILEHRVLTKEEVDQIASMQHDLNAKAIR